MSSLGRQLWAVAMVIVVLASGCSSEEDSTTDLSQIRPGIAGGFVIERALVACYQDNGIDAELFPDGAILIDKNGTLSLEESRALNARCDQRLTDDGFVLEEERTDEWIENDYASTQALRECLINEGYSIPELASFELYAAGVTAFVHPLWAVLEADGVYAFMEAKAKCPEL